MEATKKADTTTKPVRNLARKNTNAMIPGPITPGQLMAKPIALKALGASQRAWERLLSTGMPVHRALGHVYVKTDDLIAAVEALAKQGETRK